MECNGHKVSGEGCLFLLLLNEEGSEDMKRLPGKERLLSAWEFRGDGRGRLALAATEHGTRRNKPDINYDCTRKYTASSTYCSTGAKFGLGFRTRESTIACAGWDPMARCSVSCGAVPGSAVVCDAAGVVCPMKEERSERECARHNVNSCPRVKSCFTPNHRARLC